MKILYKKQKVVVLLFLIICFFWSGVVLAINSTSTSFVVHDSIITEGSLSANYTSFGLGQSVSQVAIGKATSTNFQLWSGFQYFYKVLPNTLTATAGNSQVSLSWTVPQPYLGVSATDYDLGVGTVSGSYTFQNVGNVTSFTKTGLNNGTVYYFKIKAKTLGGTFLVFSNETSATPAGSSNSGGGGGGGGGGGSYNPPPTGGDASIIIKGLAYPGANVTVLKDGAVAATTVADPQANFEIRISGLGTGVYSFSVYAEDTAGRKSTTVNFIHSLTSQVTDVVGNIFLAPTIAVSHSQIKKGDTINILGFSAPNAQVNVFVNSEQEFVEKVTASSNGGWFKAFDTSFLELGDHSTRSKAVKGESISVFSQAVGFKVSNQSIEAKKNQSTSSDINGDGKVNLIDLSILLYFWQKLNPSNPKTDINGDGKVNLIDLSIMLYNWTG